MPLEVGPSLAGLWSASWATASSRASTSGPRCRSCGPPTSSFGTVAGPRGPCGTPSAVSSWSAPAPPPLSGNFGRP
eukprot:5314846-Pyramimonas_sp.AAC.1